MKKEIIKEFLDKCEKQLCLYHKQARKGWDKEVDSPSDYYTDGLMIGSYEFLEIIKKLK